MSVGDAAIHKYHAYATMDCRATLAMKKTYSLMSTP